MRYIFIFTFLILIGCNNNSSPKEPTTEAEIQKIEAIYPYDLSLPDTKVGVYPLGDPSIEYYKDYERDSSGVIKHNGHYNPMVISKYAQANYRLFYKENDMPSLETALLHTNWLVDNIVCQKNIGAWLHTRVVEENELINESPYKSAMTNGLAISALIQTMNYSERKEEYLEAVGCALNAFAVDIRGGGVSSFDGEDELWFEEYATSSRGKVLNGALFGLAGVWMAKEYLDSKLAQLLFDKFSENVITKIHKYDYDFISLYHLLETQGLNGNYPRISHKSYNRIHTVQLLWLYTLTKESTILKYAEKFASYENYEISQILKNGSPKPLLYDTNRSSAPVYIRANDEIELILKEGHILNKIVIHYNGHYSSLPELQVATESGIASYFPLDIKLLEAGPHLTTIGSYEILSDEVRAKYKLSFQYQLEGDKNLIPEIEVITDDKQGFINYLLKRNQDAHGWPNISLPND